MALLPIEFEIQDAGDDNALFTSYTVELVDCANTGSAIIVGGYTFSTILINKPKNGVVTGEFTNVPDGIVIPSNVKYKIKNVKNGKEYVVFGDCNSAPTVICQDSIDTHTCNVTAVSLSAPNCQNSGVIIPYSFIGDELGAYKIKLIYLGQTPTSNANIETSFPDYTISNISTLQSGALNLEILESGFYKLFVGKQRDNGTFECAGYSTPTLLQCSTATCDEPSFGLESVPPSCDGNNINTNGKLIITNNNGGLKARFCKGSTFNCSNDYESAITITNNTSFILVNTLPVVENIEHYVVRVYKNATCFKDQTIAISKPACNVDFCNFTTSYDGEDVVRSYKYTNGNAQKRIYLRFDPGFSPDRFIIKRNNVELLNTGCAGYSIELCKSGVNCLQGGIICGNVQLQPNDTLEFSIDGTCSGNDVSNWTLQASCSPISLCATSVEYGISQPDCAITLPVSGIKAECLVSSVELTLEDYYGGIGTTYQFALDTTRQITDQAQITYQDSNKLTNVPKNIDVDIYIRDKTNPTCYSKVTYHTPSCIAAPSRLKGETLSITKTNDKYYLTGAIENVIAANKVEVRYFFKLTPTVLYSGAISSNQFSIQLPDTRFDEITVWVIDRTTGLKSNQVSFYVYYPDVTVFAYDSTTANIIRNECINNETYIKFAVLSPNVPTSPYIVIIRDYTTNELIYKSASSEVSPFAIKHLLDNKDVLVQVITLNDVIVNGVNKGKWATPLKQFTLNQVCVSGDCACVVKAGFYQTSRSVSIDGMKFIAAMTGNCDRMELVTYDPIYQDYRSQGVTVKGAALSIDASYNLIRDYSNIKFSGLNRYAILNFKNAQGATVKSETITIDVTDATPLNTVFEKFNCSQTSVQTETDGAEYVVGTYTTNELG